MRQSTILTTLTTAALCLTSTTALSQTSAQYNRKFWNGAGVGRLNLDQASLDKWLCKYDMVLVERIQGKPKTSSGLYVPEQELPRLHLARVLSMGPGREEENGMITAMPNFKVGDVVVLKDPWGIGPKDEETSDGRKLSYAMAKNIAAVLDGSLIPEAVDEE
mmetsp:Transcript_26343/g.40802  ORF Transcript_26343/g.40802 Transcript_26343/m.40802 type:complete len:162 (-) Transcript_26343:250-735(-)|eukprot:CAMPEP_0196802176 /NCGR_PEP_ID=MMETSP1362-20130617/1842_1 /TAXON_ID=163516 /ORGANISM="Leptocylindrus danicus, Strain CCMP1856" /LENGTH=161 /DNA_ID=CAMNT_0042173399 /DNA_START=58 /DNA_END=543 /DNA_ORIENTATION=+